MKKNLFRSVLFVLLLSAFPLLAEDMVSVRGDKANIRTKPDSKSEILWSVEKYYPFIKLDSREQWIKVKDYEGDVGWIHSSLVTDTPSVVVKKKRENIRSGPGVENKILFQAEQGVAFKVLDFVDRWVKIQHSDGETGWISAFSVWGFLEKGKLHTGRESGKSSKK